jgi:protein-S-isoprenylcysteine O-methyltransferase Ste14
MPHAQTTTPLLSYFDRCRRFFVRRRVPITLIVATTLITEDVLDWELPHSVFNVRDAWTLAGLGLITAGLLLRTWAAGILQKNETLATSGPYAITRNPLYLGSFMMMFGFCALIGDLDNFAFMAILIAIVYLPGIRSEQRRLHERFGAAWQTYCSRTPMLVPHKLWFSVTGWSKHQWLKNHEQRAVFGTAIGLLAMALWHRIMS